MSQSRRMSLIIVVAVLVVLLIVSNVVTYYLAGGGATKTVTQTVTQTIRETVTTTQLTTVTQTITTTLTQIVPLLEEKPYIRLGDVLTIVKPFLYHKHIIFYRENLSNILDRWIVNGSYRLLENGLLLDNINGCTLAYNIQVSLTRYRAYQMNISILELNNSTRISLMVPRTRTYIMSIIIDSNAKISVYLGKSLAPYQRSISLENSREISILFTYTGLAGEIFIKRIGLDDDWILLAQIYSSQLVYFDPRFGIEVCGSKVLLKNFTVYLTAGTGMRDLRPIYDWSNGKYDPRNILKDGDGYMLFFATESYYNGFAGILILRTKDLLHYETVKSILIGQPGYTGQGVLFKWIDGKIHGYLIDWSSSGPSFQGGLHRIFKVILDDKLNLLEIVKDVTLINAPPGGSMGHYDISIFQFNKTWHAVTSSFTGGTILWRLEDPTKPVFYYVKTIFPNGFENPMIYPVIDPNGNIRFLLSVATVMVNGVQWHRIYVLDEYFNPIEQYNMVKIDVYSGGHSFYLDPWYIYVHQDQDPSRNFVSGDIGPGIYFRIYRLDTNYRYYAEGD